MCLWYEAVEAHIDDTGGCTLGEVRHICGYMLYGDIGCEGTVWCEEEQLQEEDIGAAYFLDGDKVFVIKDTCRPMTAGSLNRCVWEEIMGVWGLKSGVADCDCACLLETGHPDYG